MDHSLIGFDKFLQKNRPLSSYVSKRTPLSWDYGRYQLMRKTMVGVITLEIVFVIINKTLDIIYIFYAFYILIRKKKHIYSKL